MPLRVSCQHRDVTVIKRACSHLLEPGDKDYATWFTGVELDYHLLCLTCAQSPADAENDLRAICPQCFDQIQEEGYWDGIVGRPQIIERPADLSFERQIIEVPEFPASNIIDIQPVNASSDSIWIAATKDGNLYSVNLSKPSASLITRLLRSGLNLESPADLYVSHDGSMTAVVNTFGQHGFVLDVRTGSITMSLERDDYYIKVTPFPLAFFSLDGRLLLVHGTAWNRLDVSDPETGDMLTERGPTPYQIGEEQPDHYLDYFHGRLSVSPDWEWVSDAGWIWAPVGVIRVWNLRRWVQENVWESEDGPSEKDLCPRQYYWDGPSCWVGPNTLAVWGYGTDDEWLIPAVQLFDVKSGDELRWFAGPEVEFSSEREWPQKPHDALVFDEYLFSMSEKHGVSVWDVKTGERLLQDVSFHPGRYHRGARQFISILPDGIIETAQLKGR